MSSKIDLRSIIVAHFATLRDNRTGKISWADVTTFYAVPLAFGAGCFALGVSLGATAVGILIGALSILAGLLINVLVLLYTVNVVGPTATELQNQKQLIVEVNSNLLYAVLIAVVSIIALCMVPLIPSTIPVGTEQIFQARTVFSAVIIALMGNFVLTLLMTLKRLKILLELRFQG